MFISLKSNKKPIILMCAAETLTFISLLCTTLNSQLSKPEYYLSAVFEVLV